MRVFALLVIAVVVALSTITSLGFGSRAFGFVRHIPGTDVTAHFALMGLLAFAVSLWLAERTESTLAMFRPACVVALAVTNDTSTTATMIFVRIE